MNQEEAKRVIVILMLCIGYVQHYRFSMPYKNLVGLKTVKYK